MKYAQNVIGRMAGLSYVQKLEMDYLRLEKQNKRYHKAIKEIKQTWETADNIYNHVDKIHLIIERLEGGMDD